MGAPTVYRYDDPGVPVLTGDNDAAYEVLRACLVDGYGSKPAAGWSEVYDSWTSSGIATFTNAAGTGVLGLVRSAATNRPPFVFVADAMVDDQTAVNARSGRSSVSDVMSLSESSTSAQRSNFTSRYEYWVVVANENFAIAWFGLSASYLVGSPSGSDHVSMICFGAIDSTRGVSVGNFICIGGCHTSSVSTNRHLTSFYVSGTQVAHSTAFYSADGVPESGNVYVFVSPYCGGESDFPYAEADGIVSVMLTNVTLYSSSSRYYRDGREIGVVRPLLVNNMCCRSSSDASIDVLKRLGASFLTDVISVDGRQCMIAPLTSGLVVLVCLDADLWP